MSDCAPVILIPVHNRRATTLAGLRHLQAAEPELFRGVMLLDDGSTDGTSEAVRREFPDLPIERGVGAWWWTGAIAHGMRRADALGADVVVWLNDDCRPAPGAVSRLIERVRADPRTLAAAACRDPGGRPLANGFRGRRRIGAPPAGTTTVDGASGYCLALGRPVWERIGFPDHRRWPHYAGDTSFTLRATRAGFTVCLDGEAPAEVREAQAEIDSWRRRLPPGAGWRRRWHEAFRGRGSCWRLASDWHLSCLKFGRALGPGAWLLHLLQRHLRFATVRPPATPVRAPAEVTAENADRPVPPSGTWVLVPVHNRREITLHCLRRLRDLPEAATLHQVVIDDGSHDGTSAAIAREFPAVEVLHGHGDLWWTGAIAAGMRHAFARGAEHVIWLNDDSPPDAGAIPRLIDVVRTHGGLAGGLIFADDDPVPIYSGFAEVRARLRRITAPAQTLTRCAALNGNFVCVSRAVVERIGWPAEHACPQAYGDTEYTLRAHRAGIPVLLVADATGRGQRNLSLNYARWLRDRVPLGAIWRGIPGRGSHLYPRAVWHFHTRAWGGRGGLRFLEVYARLAAATVLRAVLPQRWLDRLPRSDVG